MSACSALPSSLLLLPLLLPLPLSPLRPWRRMRSSSFEQDAVDKKSLHVALGGDRREPQGRFRSSRRMSNW